MWLLVGKGRARQLMDILGANQHQVWTGAWLYTMRPLCTMLSFTLLQQRSAFGATTSSRKEPASECESTSHLQRPIGVECSTCASMMPIEYVCVVCVKNIYKAGRRVGIVWALFQLKGAQQRHGTAYEFYSAFRSRKTIETQISCAEYYFCLTNAFSRWSASYLGLKRPSQSNKRTRRIEEKWQDCGGSACLWPLHEIWVIALHNEGTIR